MHILLYFTLILTLIQLVFPRHQSTHNDEVDAGVFFLSKCFCSTHKCFFFLSCAFSWIVKMHWVGWCVCRNCFHILLLKVDGFFSQCSVFRPVSVFAKITFGSNDIPRSSWKWSRRLGTPFLWRLSYSTWQNHTSSTRLNGKHGCKAFFFFSLHTSSEMLYWVQVQDFNRLVSCVCFRFLC